MSNRETADGDRRHIWPDGPSASIIVSGVFLLGSESDEMSEHRLLFKETDSGHERKIS